MQALQEKVQVGVSELVARNGEAFNLMPGNHYLDNISGHANEWRCECPIDSAVSGDGEEAIKNEHLLGFALWECEDRLMAALTLECWVDGVGVTEKRALSLAGLFATVNDVLTVCNDWGLPKESSTLGVEFAGQVLALKAKLAHEAVIVW